MKGNIVAFELLCNSLFYNKGFFLSDLSQIYGMFVTRYEMACLEDNWFINYVVRISHSLYFFYKASKLCFLYIIFSVIANGYIHVQVIGMYYRFLNAQ